MTNRYSGKCGECAVTVPVGAGSVSKISGHWVTFCAGHGPKEVAAFVKISENSGSIVVEIVGFAGSDFAGFREATKVCTALRVDGSWKNLCPLSEVLGVIKELKRLTPKLKLQISGEVLTLVESSERKVSARIASAKTRLADADVMLSARGQALYGYQRAGVEFLASQESAILADDMGLGKTVQALLACPIGAPILIVGPAVAKGVWSREISKWRPDLSENVKVLKGRRSFIFPRPGQVVITNYAILRELEFGECAPEGMILIADEAHAIKSHKAARSKKFKKISEAVRRASGHVWLLTATPILGKPTELWSLLQAIGRVPFKNFSEFAYKMGGSKTGYNRSWVWGGDIDPEIVEELHNIMLRRVKTDVLADLPAKRIQTFTVDITKRADLKVLDSALADWDLLGEGFPNFEKLSRARATLAAAKIPALLALVEEYAESGEPVVVFSAHRAPIDIFADREGWAVITGDTSPESRSEIEDRFQRGELRGIAATIAAGGVAITLTRASNAVFVDQDWTPALNAQAEDRIYRIGQTRGVLITRLVAAHELDIRLLEILCAKAQLIESVIDAGRVGADYVAAAAETIDTLDLAAIAAESDAIATCVAAAAAAEARYVELVNSGKSTVAESRWQDLVLERMDSRGIKSGESGESGRRGPVDLVEVWAESGLETLSLCDTDRASAENGIGFSKADTMLGNALAMRACVGLSPAEWALAVGMLCKYWRQIGNCPEIVAA